MNKKQITFLIPSMRGGGAEKVTMLLGNELVARGWEVDLLISRVEGPNFELLNPKINIVELPYKSAFSKNLFQIRSYLTTKRPHFFYCSMDRVNAIGALAHRLAGSNSKLVLSEHSNVEQILSSYSGSKFFFLNLLQLAYKRADHIVCVSEGVKQSILNLSNVEEKKLSVIYNPIESFLTAENRYTPKNREIFHLVTAGRLSPQKNQTVLIQAFNKLVNQTDKKLTLTILGEGKMRQQLEQQIDGLGLQEKVFLPGYVDLKENFKDKDLFVLSSDLEGFGNVIVEALSVGLPVVSTDCESGPAEILNHGELGALVPTNSPDELAQAIMLEIESRSEIEEKINKRIQRAKDFSVSKIVDQYEELFFTLDSN